MISGQETKTKAGARATQLVDLISIGDELLLGQTVNTNASWLAETLSEAGYRVRRVHTIADDAKDIQSTLKEAVKHSRWVILTGGLGPTKDDITKKTLAEFAGTPLVAHAEALSWIQTFFEKRGRTLTDLHHEQAKMPEGARLFRNPLGTAPGMWLELGKAVAISLPGVPYEMKALMTEGILPAMLEQQAGATIRYRILRTIGLPESEIAERISEIESGLPAHIKLAYLPSLAQVRLRITALGADPTTLEKEIDGVAEQIQEVLGDSIYGEGNLEIENLVGQLLKARGATISTAESCTGGYLAHRLTSVPGSSAYFVGSIIAYANQVKTKNLKVPKVLISKNGAVSESVVKAMAEGARKKLKTDYALATSGIAGPDGGTEEKPVGTIWLALAGPKKTQTLGLRLGSSRENNIAITATIALDLLRRELIK